MPSQRRSRILRKAHTPTAEKVARHGQIVDAARERDAKLAAIDAEFAPRIADIERVRRARRAEVFADHDRRVRLIRDATLLEA